jgi:hypothetical protein
MIDNIDQVVDQHRWLMNNGLFTDNMKDTLFLYGSIANKHITAVELTVNIEDKSIEYHLYAPNKLHVAYNKYNMLKTKKSLLAIWRIKRLLTKYGNLEISNILDSFVKTYCGPSWRTVVFLKKSSEYEDVPETTHDDKE